MTHKNVLDTGSLLRLEDLLAEAKEELALCPQPPGDLTAKRIELAHAISHTQMLAAELKTANNGI